MAASPLQLAKRALVTLLLALAKSYGVPLGINRDSTDKVVLDSFRKVVRKVHPDKGGSNADVQKLNAARELWENLQKPKAAKSTGGDQDGGGDVLGTVPSKGGFRISSTAVFLTYSGIKDLGQWRDFLNFVRASLGVWGVWRWSATLEKSKAGNLHIHLMLQFRKPTDRCSKGFAFNGVLPNAGPNGSGRDHLGEGFCRKKKSRCVKVLG